MTPTARLHDLGQSLWLDTITRRLLDSGTLARWIDECSVTGLTSNPTIFQHAIKGSADSGRRIVFGYFEGARADLQGSPPGASHPQDARRIKQQYFSSTDQLMTMFMGGEIYLLPQPTVYTTAWKLGRELGIPIAAHIVGSFGMQPEFDAIASGQRAVKFGSDNLFIHMTGMSDLGWQAVKDAGAGVSLAVPIEMNMRHGMPPILKTLATGIQPSLSVDVECTLTADMFTQMRTTMALQRAFVNQMAL